MLFGYPGSEAETEAGAWSTIGGLSADTVKAIKHASAMLFGDTDARVFDCEQDDVFVNHERDGDGAAGRREFAGIVQPYAQEPEQGEAIPENEGPFVARTRAENFLP